MLAIRASFKYSFSERGFSMIRLRRSLRDTSGAVAAEYAAIIGMLGAAIASAAYVLSDAIREAMASVAELML